jgi:septal ring factor EnvC (AmiA/AmiB activator)
MPSQKIDLNAAIAKEKQELESIRATLEEQDRTLDKLKKDFAALGVAGEALPSLDALSPEQRAQYLAFERELREIDGLLAPRRPKTKAALKTSRALV